MKYKSIVLIVILFILTIFLTTCSEFNIKFEDTGSEQTIIEFEDPGLEQVIRKVIKKPSGDIYDNELKLLQILNAIGDEIISLKGIEHCTALKALDLGENQISDLSPLGKLNNLLLLAIYNNKINDLSPLSGLTSLQVFHLNRNQIDNISQLTNLTSLVYLYLIDNPLKEEAKNSIIPLLEKNGVDVEYEYNVEY